VTCIRRVTAKHRIILNGGPLVASRWHPLPDQILSEEAQRAIESVLVSVKKCPHLSSCRHIKGGRKMASAAGITSSMACSNKMSSCTRRAGAWRPPAAQPPPIEPTDQSRTGYTSMPWLHCPARSCSDLEDLSLSPDWSCLQGGQQAIGSTTLSTKQRGEASSAHLAPALPAAHGPA
jgi:hypothetical protein